MMPGLCHTDRMASPIVALTEAAELLYDAATSQPDAAPTPLTAGLVSNGFASRVEQIFYMKASESEQYKRVLEVLMTERDLEIFKPIEGKLDPIISHPSGSLRTNFNGLVASLFISAAQRLYYLGPETSKSSFVRTVLENFDEMLRVGRGEPIRAYTLVGYSGILLSETDQVQTPWGTLRAAPPDISQQIQLIGRPFLNVSAILSAPRLVTLGVSREPSPQDQGIDEDSRVYAEQTRQLLPLAFAMATAEDEKCAPLVVFESRLIPLITSNSFSLPGLFLPPRVQVTPTSRELQMAAEWSRRLVQDRDDSLRVAERRIVSAITERTDRADSLIDAIIAWESIVGTRSETVYRVTAALSKLLESNYSERVSLRRELEKIYDIRSRVVHGELVEYSDIVNAADRAINIAIRTVIELYSRSREWRTIKSRERADRILLES